MVFKRTGIIFLCLALLPIATHAFARQQTIGYKDLAGTYVVGFSFGGHDLTLNPDGTYIMVTHAEMERFEKSGKYTVSNGSLCFTTLKSTYRRQGDSKTVNMLDPDEVKKAFGTNDGTRSELEFSLMPVRWSGRIYLMPQDSIGDFVKLINLGVEPRVNLITRSFYGDFYLRNGDEDKEVTGNPDLPDHLLKLWLKPPITATIVRIAEGNRSNIATIDKGSAQGLSLNMKLVDANSDSVDTSQFAVVSVAEQSAQVVVKKEMKVGDKLSTKYGRQVQALLMPVL